METLEAYFGIRTDLLAMRIWSSWQALSPARGSIVDAPDAELRALELLTQEGAEAFAQWNATELDFDRGATLIDLFETQVDAHAAVAALWGESSYTYREGTVNADVIAAALRSYGAGPGSLLRCAWTGRRI